MKKQQKKNHKTGKRELRNEKIKYNEMKRKNKL